MMNVLCDAAVVEVLIVGDVESSFAHRWISVVVLVVMVEANYFLIILQVEYNSISIFEYNYKYEIRWISAQNANNKSMV
jgi:hypothetical protein